MADALTWDSIFALKIPGRDELKTLMEHWSTFRQLTFTLAYTPKAICGGDKFSKDANIFLENACDFFAIDSVHDLPLPRNLSRKLKEASKSIEEAPSLLTLSLFQYQLAQLIDEAESQKLLEREAGKQATVEVIQQSQERVTQRAFERALFVIDHDPFFYSMNTILSDIESEIVRIEIKNPRDSRIVALRYVHNLIHNEIMSTRAACLQNRINKIENQIHLKTGCKDKIRIAITDHLINNHTLDEPWYVKFGKGLLNVLMAIPVAIYSSMSRQPANNLFYSFKTKAYREINLIKVNVDEIACSQY